MGLGTGNVMYKQRDWAKQIMQMVTQIELEGKVHLGTQLDMDERFWYKVVFEKDEQVAFCLTFYDDFTYMSIDEKQYSPSQQRILYKVANPQVISDFAKQTKTHFTKQQYKNVSDQLITFLNSDRLENLIANYQTLLPQGLTPYESDETMPAFDIDEWFFYVSYDREGEFYRLNASPPSQDAPPFISYIIEFAADDDLQNWEIKNFYIEH